MTSFIITQFNVDVVSNELSRWQCHDDSPINTHSYYYITVIITVCA